MIEELDHPSCRNIGNPYHDRPLCRRCCYPMDLRISGRNGRIFWACNDRECYYVQRYEPPPASPWAEKPVQEL